MDVLGYLLGDDLRASTPAPDADFWYGPVGTMTAAGVVIDSEQARKLSAWYRGRDLLATSLAMLPLPVFERLPNDEGAEVARTHPLYRTIHDKPNLWQNAFDWRRQAMYKLIDHGNSLHFIVGGRRGFAEELRPIDPLLVTAQQASSGRVIYTVRDEKTAQTRTYTQDEIFHLRGPSDDGIWGKGVLACARENLGLSLATEQYSQSVYSKGMLAGGTATVPGTLAGEALERFRDAMTTKPGQWHKPRVLMSGATFEESKLTPEAAQMILSKKHSVDDIARWLGVPRHMLDNSDPSFGNAEQFNQNFVTFSLGPWLSLFEFAINDQLIIQNDRYYAEFVRDALVRGDIASRWGAYVDAVSTGTFTRNEVRRKENMKALPGLDKPLDPAHLTGKARQVAQRPNMAPETDAQLAQAKAIAEASAGRVLRKEITAVQKLAVKHASSTPDFLAAVEAFYVTHAQVVVETLKVEQAAAVEYCQSQARQVRGDWTTALDRWQAANYAAGLAALALEGAL